MLGHSKAYLLLGIIIAALISALIPDNYFESIQGNLFITYVLILIVSIPLYICATSSVPIAAVLILKGLSPGAALVFLMAGPATNAATITVIYKTLGIRSLLVYLTTIIGSALVFGAMFDVFYTEGISLLPGTAHIHQHNLLPLWIIQMSGVVLVLLILYHTIKRIVMNLKKNDLPDLATTNIQHVFHVEGMSCNNCKMKVEKGLQKMEGVQNVHINMSSKLVSVQADGVEASAIESEIKRLGYSCTIQK